MKMLQDPPLKKIWEDEYKIRFYEVDAKSEILLPVLWNFMQETAWNHAGHLRLGYSDISEENHFWALSRLSIQVEEYPKWRDRIRVKTYLMGISRLFALRGFTVTLPDGKIVSTAKSAWVVLDLKRRKPQRIEPLFRSIQHLFDEDSMEEEPDKIPSPHPSQQTTFFPVHYRDIDVNKHVNNTKYIEWIVDSYPFEMNHTHHIHTIDINFLAESSQDDEISVHTETLPDFPHAFLHSIFRRNDGRELCRARVRWKSIESSDRNPTWMR